MASTRFCKVQLSLANLLSFFMQAGRRGFFFSTRPCILLHVGLVYKICTIST